MKKEDCKIGVEVYTDDGLMYRYIVTSLPNEEGIVEVKPSDNSHGECDSFHLEDLYLYSEEKVNAIAKQFQANLDKARDAFEAAFEALNQCREHKTQDGTYVSHYDLEELGLISTKELESTVECGGWSSSSLWC